MKYEYVTTGIFLKRPNRFLAHVLIDGSETVCQFPEFGNLRRFCHNINNLRIIPLKKLFNGNLIPGDTAIQIIPGVSHKDLHNRMYIAHNGPHPGIFKAHFHALFLVFPA